MKNSLKYISIIFISIIFILSFNHVSWYIDKNNKNIISHICNIDFFDNYTDNSIFLFWKWYLSKKNDNKIYFNNHWLINWNEHKVISIKYSNKDEKCYFFIEWKDPIFIEYNKMLNLFKELQTNN